MRPSRIAALIAALAVIACVPIALASGAASSPPTVTTAAATNATDTQVTLNGSVDPNGQETSDAFQWGPTSGYGHETRLASAGSGTNDESEAAGLAGLVPGTTYHFRIIAINASGTSVGSDMTFTTSGKTPAPTPAPAASTGGVSGVTGDGATLAGTVTPAGAATHYYFEYGSTVDYGFETPSENAGNGHSAVSVNAGISGLTPDTIYHYRLVAVSGSNTVLGSDATFRTGTGTPVLVQSHVAFIGREGFVSPGRVIGVEADCLGGTTRCTGHVEIRYGSHILGQRDFGIAPNTGGFQNIKISSYGESELLRYNHVFHLLPVAVDIDTSTGQHASTTVHLARWVWH